MTPRRPIVLALAAAALVGTTLTATGCKSERAAAGSSTRVSTERFRDLLQRMPDRVGAAVDAMKAATDGPTAGQPMAVQTFRERVEDLRWDARRLSVEASDATRDADKYFRAWATESMNTADPAKKEALRAGLSSGKRNYDAALKNLNDAGRDYTRLIDSFTNVENLLAKADSPAGIEAARVAGQQSQRWALDVQSYIARLSEQIDASLSAR